MRVPGNGDIRHRRRVRRAQVDAGGGLAGICGQVKPADLVRRVRAQQQLARCHLAAPGDLVADPAVICCGYGERAGWPVGRDEPRAARGLHISHDKHVAAAVVVPDLDHLTHRHDLPRCAPGAGWMRPGPGPRATSRRLLATARPMSAWIWSATSAPTAPTAVSACATSASLAECHRAGMLTAGIVIARRSSASASSRRWASARSRSISLVSSPGGQRTGMLVAMSGLIEAPGWKRDLPRTDRYNTQSPGSA